MTKAPFTRTNEIYPTLVFMGMREVWKVVTVEDVHRHFDGTVIIAGHELQGQQEGRYFAYAGIPIDDLNKGVHQVT